MIWKNAILAGALAMGLSLSVVPSAHADPWWKDNHHAKWQHGNGWYRHRDRDGYRCDRGDWYRRDRDWGNRDWRRYDRDWSRRDRWYGDHRGDRWSYGDYRGRSDVYRYNPRPWAYW